MEKPRNRLEQVNQIFFKFVDYVDLVSKAAIGEGIDATTMEHIKKISPTIIVGKCLDIDGRYKALIEREDDQVLFTLIGDFVTGCDVEQTAKKALNIIQYLIAPENKEKKAKFYIYLKVLCKCCSS